MNLGGFLWKRLLGITAAKSRFSKTIGIPLTRSGRHQKVGRMITGGGCLIIITTAAMIAVILIIVAANLASKKTHKNFSRIYSPPFRKPLNSKRCDLTPGF